MNFLEALADVMTETDPLKRPTAAEALEQFQSIIAKQSGVSLRWRLLLPGESPRLSRDLNSVFWELKYRLKHAICTCTRTN